MFVDDDISHFNATCIKFAAAPSKTITITGQDSLCRLYFVSGHSARQNAPAWPELAVADWKLHMKWKDEHSQNPQWNAN